MSALRIMMHDLMEWSSDLIAWRSDRNGGQEDIPVAQLKPSSY
jgi:hypothetical protein